MIRGSRFPLRGGLLLLFLEKRMTDANDALRVAEGRRVALDGNILREADDLINGDRQAAYGAPYDNFRRWSNICKATERERIMDLTPADLALIMALGKISRETNSHKRDNQVDGAAYLALYEILSTEV